MAAGDAAALPPGGSDHAREAERSELARDLPAWLGSRLGPKPFTPTLHPSPSRFILNPNLHHAEIYLANLKPDPPHPNPKP